MGGGVRLMLIVGLMGGANWFGNIPCMRFGGWNVVRMSCSYLSRL